MTWLPVILMCAIIVSVRSFPSTTRGYEKNTTPELETKTTDPIPLITPESPATLDMQTNSDGRPFTLEFVFKGPKEGLRVQNGLTRDEYTISKLPTQIDMEKLHLLDSNKANEIDTFRKNELYKLNITDASKNGDLYEAQIKRDQWLFNPQEMSSIMGGLPKYFYDTAKPIHPFPELSETAKSTANSKTEHNFQVPIQEKSYQTPQRSGPMLYPQSVFSREIDVPFYL